MRPPQVSVIMVDGGFRENFHALQYWCEQTLAEEDFELIWVDYTDSVAPDVQSHERVRTFTLGRHDEPQVLAAAYNEGIRKARGDIVVIPDADVACEGRLLEKISAELSEHPREVLYVLRLDQPGEHFKRGQDFEYLRETCSIKHTYNYGGCTAVRREWLIKMNGYEELPFFAGYHYNGGDNYIRFKNMGLRVRWHPEMRVYHPWHPIPPQEKFDTVQKQERFIRMRAAKWEWRAYKGLDPSKDRPYNPPASPPGEWPAITTERGVLHRNTDNTVQGQSDKESVISRLKRSVRQRGLIKSIFYILGTLLRRLGH